MKIARMYIVDIRGRVLLIKINASLLARRSDACLNSEIYVKESTFKLNEQECMTEKKSRIYLMPRQTYR